MLPRQFRPKLPHQSVQKIHELLAAYAGSDLAEALRIRAANVLSGTTPGKDEEYVILLVLADLASLGWRFRVAKDIIYMLPVSTTKMTPAQSKNVVRQGLMRSRDKQLREASHRSFLESMHRPRRHRGRIVSIENLIDDGVELAAALKAARGKDLREVVDPYLQLVDSKTRCDHTGLKLNDIWRYVRHTWSLLYRSTPGRTINFLLRNAARPDHPVIGIIGLANPVFQLTDRDQWIGWTMGRFARRLKKAPDYWLTFRAAAIDCLRRARDTIRSDDLLREIGGVTDPLIAARRLETLAFQEGEARKEVLRANMDGGLSSTALVSRAIPKKTDGNPDWEAASETALFRRKRAEVLADVFFAMSILENSSNEGAAVAAGIQIIEHPDPDKERILWDDPNLERACKIALREIKKNGVSSRILDVNVCGAAPTYREILGGKLAALALFSEEVQQAYCKRYGNAVSEIASAMAGRPVSRPTRISILTTTSLYGVGSSQYNRVRMRVDGEVMEWERIGDTEGFGTLHMSSETVEAVRSYAIRKQKMRNVNNKFGEGTSPLMRQLREGLELLDFDSDSVLNHSNRRIIYALRLYPGARSDLCLDRATEVRSPPMAEVSQVWRDRWLAMRIENDAVLERMAQVSAESVKKELLLGVSAPEAAQLEYQEV